MSKWIMYTAVMAVVVVAIVAGVVSYDHLHTVAIAAGEQSWIAKLVPLSADGLLVSSSLSAFIAKWQGRKVHGMTKLSLAVGLTASIAANVASPFVGNLTGNGQAVLAAIVGAWPAIALALSFEEVLRLSSMWKAEAEASPEVPEARTEVATETVRPMTADVAEVEVAEPEVVPLPEVATPSVRKSTRATAPRTGSVNTSEETSYAQKSARGGTSMKAEAMRYLATKPETSAADLAVKFDRSERWARMMRKDFQEAQQAVQKPRELVAV